MVFIFLYLDSEKWVNTNFFFLCFLVGCSSPHLVQVRERIRINGQPIGKELFTKYFWQVYGRLDETKVHRVTWQRCIVHHLLTLKCNCCCFKDHGYSFTSMDWPLIVSNQRLAFQALISVAFYLILHPSGITSLSGTSASAGYYQCHRL